MRRGEEKIIIKNMTEKKIYILCAAYLVRTFLRKRKNVRKINRKNKMKKEMKKGKQEDL